MQNKNKFEPLDLIPLDNRNAPPLLPLLNQDNDNFNKPLINLAKSLRDLIDKSKLTDITFSLKEGKQMQAHKAILIARIPEIESKISFENPSLLFKDVSQNVFSLFLEWIYSGTITEFRTVPHSKEESWERCVDALELLSIAYDLKIIELNVFILFYFFLGGML